MQDKKISVNDWLKGNCPFKGCFYNDGFGSCWPEDIYNVHNILGVARKPQNNSEDPYSETFICKEADFDIGSCEYCGSELIEKKDYPTGEKQFQPVIYEICSNTKCEGSAI